MKTGILFPIVSMFPIILFSCGGSSGFVPELSVDRTRVPARSESIKLTITLRTEDGATVADRNVPIFVFSVDGASIAEQHLYLNDAAQAATKVSSEVPGIYTVSVQAGSAERDKKTVNTIVEFF